MGHFPVDGSNPPIRFDYANISGQTSNSLSATVTGKFGTAGKLPCGSTVAYTDTAEFTTYPYFNPGTISLGTVDSTAWNTKPLPVSGTLASGGRDSVYSYQWFYSTNGSTFYPITDGGQGVNYQPPVLTVSTYYYRQATCASTTRTSNTVLLPVQTVVFNPGTISPYTTVVSSGSSPTLTGSASTGGTSATYTYQWQQSYDEIAGPTSAQRPTPAIHRHRSLEQRISVDTLRIMPKVA